MSMEIPFAPGETVASRQHAKDGLFLGGAVGRIEVDPKEDDEIRYFIEGSVHSVEGKDAVTLTEAERLIKEHAEKKNK